MIELEMRIALLGVGARVEEKNAIEIESLPGSGVRVHIVLYDVMG